jgi:hypothetical protein
MQLLGSTSATGRSRRRSHRRRRGGLAEPFGGRIRRRRITRRR